MIFVFLFCIEIYWFGFFLFFFLVLTVVCETFLSTYETLSCADSDKFTSFPILVLFFFSLLDFPDRVSDPMLNLSGWSEHPFLFLKLSFCSCGNIGPERGIYPPKVTQQVHSKVGTGTQISTSGPVFFPLYLCCCLVTKLYPPLLRTHEL